MTRDVKINGSEADAESVADLRINGRTAAEGERSKEKQEHEDPQTPDAAALFAPRFAFARPRKRNL